MRILVTGALGRLGGRLVELLTPEHEQVTGIDIDDLDITDFAATKTFITDLKPEIVLHPAAWTDVDGCAREPEKAMQINGYGAQNVAAAASSVGAAVLYISSNEVFRGDQNTPYYEYDPYGPVNPYGYSKMVGERGVTAVNPQHYIVRTSWLFAHGGKNFIQAILGAVAAGKQLRVVTNEVAHPTYTNDLAEAIAKLIQTGRYGTYHLVNEGACSRYAFARYALDRAGHTDVPVQPIVSSEWPRASVPPDYTALANVAGRMVGVTLRPWQAAVDAFLEKEGLLAPA